MGGAWGPYSVMGPQDWTRNSLSHEMHHIWQSRSFNVNSIANNFGFLSNYGLQGVNATLMGSSFIGDANYFETLAYGASWW